MNRFQEDLLNRGGKKMYEKVDEVLSENSSNNYFFDDEFLYVRELLSEFTKNDWKNLTHNLKSKKDKYKIRLG